VGRLKYRFEVWGQGAQPIGAKMFKTRQEQVPFLLAGVVLQNGETYSLLSYKCMLMRCVIYGVAVCPATPVAWYVENAASPDTSKHIGGCRATDVEYGSCPVASGGNRSSQSATDELIDLTQPGRSRYCGLLLCCSRVCSASARRLQLSFAAHAGHVI